MKKRILATLLAAIMIFAFVACANDPAPAAPADGDNDVAEQPADDPPANDDDDGDAPAVAGDTIVIQTLGLCYERYEAASALGNLNYPYYRFRVEVGNAIREALYPTPVEFVDWGWAEALDQRQRSMIAAGDIPDVVVGEIFMPTYANEGILYPLPQDIVDAVNPSFMVFDNDGNAVAVAHRATAFMLFYNRDLLEAAGFSQAPTTWDEFREMSAAITELGAGEFWGGGIPSFPHAGGALRATPFFRQMGIDFFKDGDVQLDDPRLIEALEFIREMDAFLPPGLGNQADEGPLWNAFQEDQIIGFVINGTWQASGAERMGMNWGAAPLPIPVGGQEGNCLVAAVYVGVPRGARNPEASFEVIRISIAEEFQKIWMEDTMPSVRQSIIDNPSMWPDNPVLEVAFDAVSGGEVTGLASFPSNDAQIWEIINQQVLARATIDTGTSIQQIVDDALAQIRPLLD